MRSLSIALYIGDLPWEKKRMQKVSADLEIDVQNKPPDYWEISKNLLEEFSASHYEWLEDLAQAMARHLKRRFKLRGKLILKKFPKVPHSPKIFEVEVKI